MTCSPKKEEPVTCPICFKDLSVLHLYEREAHCDTCIGRATGGAKRKRSIPLPDVKKVRFRDTTVVVDGFMYMDDPTVDAYFLSHFHADHYQGLSPSWKQGPLYCSAITARLAVHKFKIAQDMVTVLYPGIPHNISSVLRCIPLDANHCPGALILLFEELDERGHVHRSILHTGDFRATTSMVTELLHITGERPIDMVYLDTTYLHPYYHFPLQESVITTTADFAAKVSEVGLKAYFADKQKSILTFARQRKTPKHSIQFRYLYLIGSYSIGKERLAVAIAERLRTKLYIPADSEKHRMIERYKEWFPDGLITHVAFESCVHLVPFEVLSSKDSISNYMKTLPQIYEDIIAFSPTGWAYANRLRYIPEEAIKERFACEDKRHKFVTDLLHDATVDSFTAESLKTQYNPSKRYQLFRIPYSEHSSFKDLSAFATAIQMDCIRSTVNLASLDMHRMWFDTWSRIRNEKFLRKL
ncbi:AaceriADR250Cp [[Ashbya] aceris (nom. inval.)]|nr:AaceriADR250Cp [[Ashbya] aceris (nom. inval.)]